jgi:putative drug exporter of the RND superfamily
VIVCGAFAFTSVVVTKEMGLGMAIAVLVDATIIRTLLVPATMRLLGRWNWWMPGRPLPPKQAEMA